MSEVGKRVKGRERPVLGLRTSLLAVANVHRIRFFSERAFATAGSSHSQASKTPLTWKGCLTECR